MTLVLAERDASVVLAEALQIYKDQTGVTLAPADPRRQHLQTLLLLLAQHRSLIDFAGKQSMLRYVSSLWIQELAALWGESLLPSLPSHCTMRFHYSTSATHTIPAGTRVTDGTSQWAVGGRDAHGNRIVQDATGFGFYVDCNVNCTVNGNASNDVAIGQIATLVDPLANVVSVENLSATINGRDIEGTEAFRTRLRSVPESRSTCGPRLAYEAAAMEVAAVADARALGPDDGDDMAGYPPDPGEVWILIIEGQRDTDGTVVSVIPDPAGGLLTAVDAACSAEDVRPLTDFVTVKAPDFVDFDINVTYYIARSRIAQTSEIQAAVLAAFDAWKLAQIRIGLDINPDALIQGVRKAGAKRCVVTSPAFTVIFRDQCPRNGYGYTDTLTFGGIEND